MMTRRVLVIALPLLLAGGAATTYAQQRDSAGALPRLVNGSEVAEALGSRHPAVLREQGIGGSARVRLYVNEEGEPDTVRTIASTGLYRLDRGIGGSPTVWFKVGVDGRVTYRTISETSGNCEFDRAALSVASVMEFDPALNYGEPIAVWVEIPIVFRAR